MAAMRIHVFAIISIIYLLMRCECSEALKIWGPGLRPDAVVLPARYFFVESSKPVKVRAGGESLRADGPCRVWLDRLDRKDGSLLFRYRLYEPCRNFVIQIESEDGHVGDSPYRFPAVLDEACDCPRDFGRWSREYGCDGPSDRLRADLEPFEGANIANMTEEFKRALEHFDRPGSVSICFYAIKDNRLYRKCHGAHVGFHIFSDAILLSVLRKTRLPDQAFIINLGDWPLVRKSAFKTRPVPVFSWCGSDDTYDMALPTYDLAESTLENMGRVSLDMLSVQGNIEKKWDDKIPQAFWRGRDSRRERLDLMDIARRNPELYNVSMTNFFFFREEQHKYGKTPHVSFYKFFDYKYQLSIDGTVAAYRFPYLLAGDSLVLKQESPYYEHFYEMLRPGEHYLPFKRDLSDLTDKIRWAMENDEQVRKMADNSRKFANDHLLPKDIICYYAVALNEWSKRSIPLKDIPDEMELVPQNEDPFSNCCSASLDDTKDEL